MKETGLLNIEISDAIAHLGHMDELIICDAGFPIPVGIRTIDISLKANQPTTLEALTEILQHFSVEKIVLAEETRKHSPSMFARQPGRKSYYTHRRFHSLFQYSAGLRCWSALVY
jgi:D-ribose pyranase